MAISADSGLKTLEPKAPQVDPHHSKRRATSMFDPTIMQRAVVDSFVKLNPRQMARNPVMFVVEIGSVLTTFSGRPRHRRFRGTGRRLVVVHRAVRQLRRGRGRRSGQGAGRHACARRGRRPWRSSAKRRLDAARRRRPSWQIGDLCVVDAGELIPGDGDVVEGIASVDESAITGESAPVIRESGGDRSAVTGGTRVLSDQIVVQITIEAGRDLPRSDDRPRRRARAARRRRTRSRSTSCSPVSRSSSCLAVVTLQPFAIYSHAEQSITVLVALLVCLIPTTIGALLSAIGIAGMDRLVQRNVLAMSGRAVEAAGDCNTLLLDKTGTITYGNRMAAEFLPVGGVDEQAPRRGVLLVEPRRRDTRRSIDRRTSRRTRYDLDRRATLPGAELVPFTAQTRMSGIDFERSIDPQGRGRLGSPLGRGAGRHRARTNSTPIVEAIASNGGTPLVGRRRPRRCSA